MFQYYIIEITRTHAGEYAHNVLWAYDEDINRARLKGESKYYERLAAAAVSGYASHAVTLMAADGTALMSKAYVHAATEG